MILPEFVVPYRREAEWFPSKLKFLVLLDLPPEPFGQLASETREVPEVVLQDATGGPGRRPGLRGDDEPDRYVAEWIGAKLHPKFAQETPSYVPVPCGTASERVEKLAQASSSRRSTPAAV
jgi:hypothetical protein